MTLSKKKFSVRRQTSPSRSGSSSEVARRGFQIRQEVQVLQHQQPLDEPGSYQEQGREPLFGHGGHRQPQDPGGRHQGHPAGNGRRRGHEVLRECLRSQRSKVNGHFFIN